MQGMDIEDKSSKMYCMRGKHVAIICGVVSAVALILGLGLGLGLKPEVCYPPEDNGQVSTKPPTQQNHSSTTPQVTPPSEPSVFCSAKNDKNGPWINFRLPNYVQPVHYDLDLTPEMEAEVYTGMVNISISLKEQTTRHLWLHLRETKITEIPELRTSSGQEIAIKRCFGYEPSEYVVIEAEEDLRPSNYVLSMKFKGYLNGSLVGFYRTSYEENGKTKYIAATDHEPTDARKSFPCFDEPNKKATYTISITHERDYEALSNMPVEKTVPIDDKWTKTIFRKSVKMSTYLVAWAVHQFKHEERKSSRGIPLRIYAQPLQLKTASYAADVTKVVFDYFEDYFSMNYSLPKLDKIAIPDFGTGAMENWGLITYRETNLLYDSQESAASNKQRVAAVVAHELVHQWFGNIVTMDWWDDLWLNEGFASFFEFMGVNATEANWQMLDQILIDDLLPVLKDDSLVSSHPITVNVSSPDEITSVFDGISYSKGASILRMLEDWISPENFRAGCQKYLTDHEFNNAKTDDFWKAMEEVSGKPVKEVMDTWTRQMGYPVLKVNNSKSTVTQQRFLLDPKADPSKPSSPFSYKWNIPVKWEEGKTSNITFYNKSASAGITIPRPGNPPPDSFLKVNKDHVGFYRVNYEPHVWRDVADIMRKDHQRFSLADRAGFIDDAFALARAGLLKYADALNLTKYLLDEKEYIPWQRAVVAVSYIGHMIEDDTILYPKFQRYFGSLVKPIATELKWETDGDHIKSLLRTTVLEFACNMNDPQALANASSQFETWMNGTRLDVNIRLLVYRYGMQQSGDEEAWNYMFHQYTTATLAQEKEKLLYGLASVKNITLLNRFLNCIKNTTLIRSQDVFTVLRYISLNSYGKTMAWDWVRLNWEYLVKRYTLNDRNLGRLISRISGTFNTELQLWQMENFFERYPDAGAGEASRKQALETTKSNIEWLKLYRDDIATWLKDL
ncbi:PREDICTED: glutamyl aminopeptidase [Thamnophis sirtalis]|uniref:Aminopeptidase n=1 Tax=Thamnophis sirtalis TaxID=35019 RepID=A0A6I9WZA2_9SAUR|nr:PREDICTED: glutamyl aminopeptidase [Thamnophis sirtalis]